MTDPIPNRVLADGSTCSRESGPLIRMHTAHVVGGERNVPASNACRDCTAPIPAALATLYDGRCGVCHCRLPPRV